MRFGGRTDGQDDVPRGLRWVFGVSRRGEVGGGQRWCVPPPTAAAVATRRRVAAGRSSLPNKYGASGEREDAGIRDNKLKREQRGKGGACAGSRKRAGEKNPQTLNFFLKKKKSPKTGEAVGQEDLKLWNEER